jgi:hypothetical protein
MALEIRELCSYISIYLREDLNQLNANFKENPLIYFSGDILQHSDSLLPEIEKVNEAYLSENSHKHIKSVKRLTRRLNYACYRLEKCSGNGTDFLPLLKKSLKKFNKIQKVWLLTL